MWRDAIEESISTAVCTYRYDSGAWLQARVYSSAPPGFPEDDRIQLLIAPAGEATPRGWMMTQGEAGDIIATLHEAIDRVKNV